MTEHTYNPSSRAGDRHISELAAQSAVSFHFTEKLCHKGMRERVTEKGSQPPPPVSTSK